MAKNTKNDKNKTPEFKEDSGIFVQDHILIKDKTAEREIVNKRA